MKKYDDIVNALILGKIISVSLQRLVAAKSLQSCPPLCDPVRNFVSLETGKCFAVSLLKNIAYLWLEIICTALYFA